MSGENYNPGCDGRPGRPSSRYPPWEYQESPNPRRYLSHHDYYDGYGSRRQQDYIPRAYQLPSLARGDPDPYLLGQAQPQVTRDRVTSSSSASRSPRNARARFQLDDDSFHHSSHHHQQQQHPQHQLQQHHGRRLNTGIAATLDLYSPPEPEGQPTAIVYPSYGHGALAGVTMPRGYHSRQGLKRGGSSASEFFAPADAAVPRRPQQAQGPGLGYPSYRPDHSPIKSSSSPSSRGDINKDQQLHQRPHFGPTENQRIAVVKPIKHSASAPSTQDQRSTEGVRVGGIPVQTQTSPWHQMPSLPGDPGVSTSSTPRPSTGSLPPPPGSGPGVTALNITPPVKQEQHLGKHITSLSKTDSVKEYVRKGTLTFFGVEESNESELRERWNDRRKRLASKCYGELKEEFQTPPARGHRTWAHSGDVPDGPGTRDYRSLRASVDRSKDSVAKLTFDGIAYVISTLSRGKKRQERVVPKYARSYVPSSTEDDSVFAEDSRYPPPPAAYRTDGLQDEVFFDVTPKDGSGIDGAEGDATAAGDQMKDLKKPERVPFVSPQVEFLQPRRSPGGWRRGSRSWQGDVGAMGGDEVDSGAKGMAPPGGIAPRIGTGRIHRRLLDNTKDNSNRRQYGMGVIGRFFNRSFRRSVRDEPHVKEQLDDMDDYRPYFTYWVTIVQFLICIISLACYRFGPVGFELQQQSSLVLVTSLSLQQVDYWEPSNFWLGPRAADLIHLGAKFAPCMRRDARIYAEIEKTRAEERETACCIRNDKSGCVQASKRECSGTLSTWKKWGPSQSGPGGRISGSVCGQDPSYCKEPASIAPYEWPDDITRWPICKHPLDIGVNLSGRHVNLGSSGNAAEHMVCEVIGHPCCIGIHGECSITTREYCEFVHGFFHEKAALCSQVSCLDDVCGMIPFHNPEIPDQFYRLWTSIFLHAGLIHLVITLVIQFTLMRDLEKMAGPLRIGIIYIMSGVAGNLASSVFVPYQAEVGPAGSQFGLLACLFVEVINVWPMLKQPSSALLRLLVVTLILFLLGLLPWVDNYAHVFGFIFGFLLSYALLPFVSFGSYERRRKLIFIWVCLLAVVVLFSLLIVLFYVTPFYECELCKLLTCIPLTDNFCADQNINFNKPNNLI